MKLLAALAGLMLAIAAVAGFVFVCGATGACTDHTLEEARSADGRVGALLYERLCGEDRTTRLKLWMVGDPRTPSDVWAVAGPARPHVRFGAARSIVLAGASGIRPLLLETTWRDVSISTE